MSPTIASGRWALASPRLGTGLSWALAVGLAVGLAVVGPAVVLGQDEPATVDKVSTTISVSFEPSPMDGIPHYLAARLVAQDGSAVIGQRVRIQRTADAFGGRTVTIGRGTTDNAGVARVPVEPREEVYTVTASFSGDEGLEASKVVDDIVFPSELVILPERAPQGGLVDPQLRPLADVMPLVIGLGVVLVWVVLLGLTAVTLRRIRTDAGTGESVPDTERAESLGAGPGSQG